MKQIIASLLVLTLSACGWHLRGSASGDDKLAMTAPMNLVINAKDNHSPLVNSLRESLHSYKINEVKTAAGTALTLNLGVEKLDRRTAGVGSDALTSAYEMTMTVDYSVSNAESTLTPKDTIARVSRTYNYNVNNANSAEQEEELTMIEMRRELAHSILRRVKSINAKAEATATTQQPAAATQQAPTTTPAAQ